MIYDVIVVGAGAAGLMTAITAKKAGVPSVLILDSKEKIGAKILMSGGTRCNLTNESVSEKDFQTEQKNILKSVLQFYSSDKAVAFFQNLGVEVVREEGGKYFPSTHSGRTVLEALEKEVRNVGAEIQSGKKVTKLVYDKDRFLLSGADFKEEARRVVLTTGGLSYPGTGSDGTGYELAKSFGHRIIETSPSLTPLTSGDGDWKTLAGTTLPVKLTLRKNHKSIADYEGSFLFTHFGFSGPVVLNLSRHWIREKDKSALSLEASFIPDISEEVFQKKLMARLEARPGNQLKEWLYEYLPNRLAEMVLKKAGVTVTTVFNQLTKEKRQAVLKYLFRCPLDVSGALGYEKAEVTAGGVDLSEVQRKTLESKMQPGLFFAGEILDVDGRIGGFNFQWAWSSGMVAGLGAAQKASA